MSAGYPADFRPRRLHDVIVRPIAGEVFLVPIRGRLADLQELFMLNSVGEWIWGHLDGELSIGDVTAGMVDQFEVTSEQAHADLEVFLGELDEAGLLSAAEGATA